MGMVPLMPPDGVERHPAQQEAQADHPWAIRLAVCRGRVPARALCRPPAPLAGAGREAAPVPGTVSARDGPGGSLARRRRVEHTRAAHAPEHLEHHGGRLAPAPRVRHALHAGAPRGGRHRPLPAAVGGPCDALAAGCGRAALGWERAWRACGRPSLRDPTVPDPQHGAPRPGGRGAADPGSDTAGRCPDHCRRGRCPGGGRGRGSRDGTRGAGRGRVCQGRHGARARLPGARGLPRWLGSDTAGGAATLAHEQRGAGRSPRGPAEATALGGPVAPPRPRHGLAGLPGGDHPAVCAAPAARGRVAAVAPQRAGGPEGGAAGSPSARLHAGRCVSAGPPPRPCRRSAARLPRPAARRQALWARHHRQRAPGRTGHGAAVALSPVWGAPAAGPAVAGSSLSRPQRRAVSPQLVAYPLDCVLSGRPEALTTNSVSIREFLYALFRPAPLAARLRRRSPFACGACRAPRSASEPGGARCSTALAGAGQAPQDGGG